MRTFLQKARILILLTLSVFLFVGCTGAEPSSFPYGDETNPYKNLTVEEVENIRVEIPAAAYYTYADLNEDAVAEMVEALRAVTLNGTADEVVYGQYWKIVIRFAEGGKSELFVGALFTIDEMDYNWKQSSALELLCEKAFQ